MVAISSAGIGSGLDIDSLVSKLMAAERAPAENRISTNETKTKAQISAFGAIKSAMTGLEEALKKLNGVGNEPGRKTTVGEDAGFTASASSSAALGSYSVVVEQMATAHKLQSAAVSKDTQLGHGTLTLQVGDGESFEVNIESGKGTLADIRDAINTQAAGKGVTATIVRGDAGDVLVLSSSQVGSAGAMSIQASGGDGGLAALNTTGGSMTVAAAAQDAILTVDGITRTVSDNKVTDVIDGVTLDLSKAKPGEAFRLEVGSDASTLKASMLNFISAYNTAIAAVRTQSAAGGEGKVAGALSGDSSARNMIQTLRNAIGNNYGDFANLGLKTAVDGSLSLDGTKFDTAIAANPNAVKGLLGEESGVGKNLRDILLNFNGTNGLLADRSKGLDDRMKSITKQRTDLDARMERLEASYRRQFVALDAMMGQMQSTSTYISQQLSLLSNSNNSR